MKRRFARLTVSGVCLVFLAATIGPAVSSASASIDSKRAEAIALQNQIDANGEKISQLDEQYDAANLRLSQAQKNIAAVSARLTAAQKDTDRIRSIVGRRAAEIYMGAGAQTPLDGLDVSSAQEVGVRAKYAATTADRDARLLGQLAASKQDLKSARTTLEAAQKQAQSEVDALNANRAAVESANAQQQHLLSKVKGEIATLISQAQAAAARAAKAHSDAIARQQRLSTASSGSGGGGGGGGHDPGGINMPVAPAPSGGAAQAVAYAQQQLGKPYQYAGAGPNAYDCSGLTMMAWASAGVGMPHSSFAQATMFPRVADSAMMPGDLVIYYADHHHVGLYVGGGMTISATHTGDYIRLQPVFRPGFQFAVRPG